MADLKTDKTAGRASTSYVRHHNLKSPHSFEFFLEVLVTASSLEDAPDNYGYRAVSILPALDIDHA